MPRNTKRITELENFVKLATRAIAVLQRGDSVELKAGTSTLAAFSVALSTVETEIKKCSRSGGKRIDVADSKNPYALEYMRQRRAKKKELQT